MSISSTQNVSGTFDGGMKTYCCIGDGGQSESQDPMFKLANGATLQNVNRIVADNQESVKNSLRNLETFTGALARNSEKIDGIMVKVDGVMGQLSRTAVKAMQVKYGLPADSWPTAELLARMRGPGVQAQPAGMVMPAAR